MFQCHILYVCIHAESTCRLVPNARLPQRHPYTYKNLKGIPHLLILQSLIYKYLGNPSPPITTTGLVGGDSPHPTQPPPPPHHLLILQRIPWLHKVTQLSIAWVVGSGQNMEQRIERDWTRQRVIDTHIV